MGCHKISKLAIGNFRLELGRISVQYACRPIDFDDAWIIRHQSFMVQIFTITDINECGLDKGGCDHKCINRAGYYHCACEEGYTLQSDNKTCLAGN